MKLPFEKFVVQTNNVNDFYIRVASPEEVRETLEDPALFAGVNTQPEHSKLMMERYLFINDAIQEKLEREKEQ